MTLRLMLRGLRRGKARFLCAVLGIAAAVGAVVPQIRDASVSVSQSTLNADS